MNKQIPISLSCVVYYALIQNNNKAINVEYIEKLTQTVNNNLIKNNLNYEINLNDGDITKMVNASMYVDFFNNKIKLLTEVTLIHELKKLKDLVKNALTEQVQKIIDISMQELTAQQNGEQQKETER